MTSQTCIKVAMTTGCVPNFNSATNAWARTECMQCNLGSKEFPDLMRNTPGDLKEERDCMWWEACDAMPMSVWSALEGRTQIKGASRSFSWRVSLLMVDKSNTIYIHDENVYCFTVEISSLLYTTGFLSNMHTVLQYVYLLIVYVYTLCTRTLRVPFVCSSSAITHAHEEHTLH
jgi:hypothetical protein